MATRRPSRIIGERRGPSRTGETHVHPCRLKVVRRRYASPKALPGARKDAATIATQRGSSLVSSRWRTGADAMRDRVDELPVVRCPGCHSPMQPKERSSATRRLVDIRYVCMTCDMETKRTIAEEP